MRKAQVYMPDAQFTEIVSKSKSLTEVRDHLNANGYGGDIEAIKRRIDVLNLDTAHFPRKIKYKRRPLSPGAPWVYFIPEADFISIAKQVDSYVKFAIAAGHPNSRASSRKSIRKRAAQLGVSLDHFVYAAHGLRPERVLVKDTPINITNSRQLRELLVKHQYFKDACQDCGIGPQWQGEPLNLKVHRKNGDIKDLSPENLMLLCPNCLSQHENPRWEERAKKISATKKRKKETSAYKALAR